MRYDTIKLLPPPCQALIGLNSRRKVFSVLRGPFNEDGIVEYVRDMTGGRGRTTKFRGESLPAINTVEAWDGQDGEVGDPPPHNP